MTARPFAVRGPSAIVPPIGYFLPMPAFGLTDHLEGPRDRPSAEIFDEVADLVRLADELGVRYAWFTEHHAHAHHGHLPTPAALRPAPGRPDAADPPGHGDHLPEPPPPARRRRAGGRRRRADGRPDGRRVRQRQHARGVRPVRAARDRRARAPRPVRRGPADHPRGLGPGDRADPEGRGRSHFGVPPHRPLPVAAPDLAGRCWLAVNSAGSARIAGSFGFNMLFSHLGTPEQYRAIRRRLPRGGRHRACIAANRPVFVGARRRRPPSPSPSPPCASSGGGSATRARSPPTPPSPGGPKTSAATRSTSSSAGPNPSPEARHALHDEVPLRRRQRRGPLGRPFARSHQRLRPAPGRRGAPPAAGVRVVGDAAREP